MRYRIYVLSSSMLVLGWLSSLPTYVYSQVPYYQDKTITILRGGRPGGFGDLQTRAMIPYLKKYLAGNPTIIIEHMAGAAGRKAANHIYSSVKPDGLTIGAVGTGLISGPILGLTGTSYDLDKFIYLGSTDSGNPTGFATRREAGLDSLEKLRASPGVRIGAHSIGHITYVNGRFAAFLLNLREAKFVVGYSSQERVMALVRGEVDAGSVSSATIQQHPELQEKVHFHTIITVPKGRYLPPYSPDIPEIDSFAETDRERLLLSLYRAFNYSRWPYFLPRATPAELVNALREAMAKSFKDPGFSTDFKKLTGDDPSPISWKEVETSIKELPRDPETIALYKQLADHGPLPPR